MKDKKDEVTFRELGEIINSILLPDGTISYHGQPLVPKTSTPMDAVVQKEAETKEEKTLDSIEKDSKPKDGNSWMSGTTMDMWKEYEDGQG
jgi:hypothetical protein|tara:strand:- start:520 stop:792 length:273 start_codon:yes stop_codon:yes gene_type:complete